MSRPGTSARRRRSTSRWTRRRYGQGPLTLALGASDAAGVPAGISKTVYVDNSTPTVTLSGPVDAPSTAGTQYVTATAGGSPSGIANIVCTVDGGPGQTYSGASAQVPVSGIGPHTVSCYANDNAVDPTGAHGQSPTASLVAEDRAAHGARHRVRQARRPQLPPGPSPRQDPRPLDHRPPPRQARQGPDALAHEDRARHALPPDGPCSGGRSCSSAQRRHGHIVKLKRVRARPRRRAAARASRTPPGSSPSDTGRPSMAGSAPRRVRLSAGQVVHVLTAPDNGSGAFSEAATRDDERQRASGRRSCRPGPSRIVEAVYDGSSDHRVIVVGPGQGSRAGEDPDRDPSADRPLGRHHPDRRPRPRWVRAGELEAAAAQRRDRPHRPHRGPPGHPAERSVRDPLEVRCRARDPAPVVLRGDAARGRIRIRAGDVAAGDGHPWRADAESRRQAQACRHHRAPKKHRRKR